MATLGSVERFLGGQETMGMLYGELVGLLKSPAVVETAVDVLLCAVPIWVAVMVGLVIGWSWRPRWTGLVFLGLRSRFRYLWTVAPPGIGASRLWFAFTALSAFSLCRRLWSHFRCKDGEAGEGARPVAPSRPSPVEGDAPSSSSRCGPFEREQDIVVEKDLEHLLHILDGKVGDGVWKYQMERTMPNMTYQAWRHESKVSPIIYRSRIIFEDATPELVRDFLWDDDFRLKWDPMLVYCKALEEFPQTGTMVVHWIKKFPFFCSDREYIIGRRIWESENTYYCITKGVPYASLPKSEKPKRVEQYFSSWRIKAVKSRKQDGQLSSCEVTLVHYEDMGIPRDVAKAGVRHGMWGAVKKLQSGMRAYQHRRNADSSLSRYAVMARITTRVPSALNLLDSEASSSGGNDTRYPKHGMDWKLIAIGGTIAIVCCFQTGIVSKALLLGAARRLSR